VDLPDALRSAGDAKFYTNALFLPPANSHPVNQSINKKWFSLVVRRLSNQVLTMLSFLCAIRLDVTQHKKDIKIKRQKTEHRSGYISLQT